MSIWIKHVDVNVGTGKIVGSAEPTKPEDTIYRVDLSHHSVSGRSALMSSLLRASTCYKSTWARLNGDELPHYFNANQDGE